MQGSRSYGGPDYNACVLFEEEETTPRIMKTILALWTHPRSRSTAFERVMIERGDMTVLHEPFSYLYYVRERQSVITQEHIAPTHPTTYEGIRGHIDAYARQGPVFFKDMAVHCWRHLQDDRAFVRRLVNTFLIREPASTIASFYAKYPEVSRNEIGYEQLWELFGRVHEVTQRLPVVIDADELVANAPGMLRAYCTAVGLPFMPHALRWASGHLAVWNSWKQWHVDVSQSTELVPRANIYATTVGNSPHLRTYYDYHLPFYQALHQHRIQVCPLKMLQ